MVIKKFFILIALCVAAFQHFYKSDAAKPTSSISSIIDDSTPSPTVETNSSSSVFSCQGKTHCSEMNSYAEAKFYLDNCPGMKVDGDNDGIPCERQFGQ